ncbi:thioredoxin domain-containing protein [Paraconexibacter algicola]|uniref:Thioredoxin domain-containing protein n=1 Tax=Paraconexibacter algicola TaxID=2133960 RepID=A0A2T4UDS8_9ACTN|nr:thioredoxin domain-containing protein [Paraconexibacter algicola]PTL55659.1 thioredoxin domain-containing protein [Paraconexibacter algicola]
MPNALQHETSPYLLQHAGNPVDWLPWGPEALARARREDRPLLLSIGYSACHWCHVMERESFEDPRTAALMNQHFVCVKVDREERPDLDAIYMDAVQAMTGHGGWPLNVFLTPDQVPFFGGTYSPPEPRQGMPSWTQLLEVLAEAWATRRDEIEEQGERMVARISGGARLRASGAELTRADLDGAVDRLRESFDSVNGGWGGAPKFPQAPVIELLLALGERSMSGYTLRSMAGGGINDQIGGGFARYSVDARWTVPHFEKMLSDNALLARAYLHGWQLLGDDLLRRTAEETLDWALREMRAADGGFHAALDADADGVEGASYVWTLQQLEAALDGDPASDEAIAWLGATVEGNFSDPEHPELAGRNVLESRGAEPWPEVRARVRARLLQARDAGPRPGVDDKRLTAWNALLLDALARSGAVLGRADHLEAARETAAFVLERLRDGDGRLLRTFSRGTARYPAYLEDHAFLLEALLTLYEATGETRWFSAARELADELLARFLDREHGGFFSTADDHEPLVTRRKDIEDAPLPAGGSAAAHGLLRLAALTGERRYRAAAEGQLALLAAIAPQHPAAFGHLLRAALLVVAPVHEVAIVGPAGPERDALVSVVHEQLRPGLVLAVGDGDPDGEAARTVPLLAGRPAVDGVPTAYVCERFACRAPVTTPDALRAALAVP